MVFFKQIIALELYIALCQSAGFCYAIDPGDNGESSLQ